MIEIIFTDLDGTLLNSSGKISDNNFAACIKAQKQGIPVVINTGRYGENALEIAKTIKVDQYHGYSIGNDGAEIWSFKDKKWIYLSQLNFKETNNLAKWLLKYDSSLLLNFSCIDSFYVNRLYEKWEQWLAQLQIKITEIKDFTKFDKIVSRVMVILENPWNDKKVKQFINKFKQQFPNLTIAQYHHNTFSISQKNTSKGAAIIWLCHHLGLDVKKALAMGDNANDLSMLEIVGYPVVMGNADEKFKGHGKWIAPDNNDHGVAQTIEYYLSQ